MWFDRLLMLIEIGVLLWMLRTDQANSKAIQKFLRERELWYARRLQAKVKTMQQGTSSQQTSSAEMQKPPADELGANETVELLKEAETEQQSAQQSENL